MRKKIFLIILTFILVLTVGFVGCNNATDSDKDSADGNSVQAGEEQSSGEQGQEQGGEEGGQQGSEQGQQGQQGEQGEEGGNGESADYDYALFVEGEEGYSAFSEKTLKKILKTDDVVTVKDAEGNTLSFVDWEGPQTDGEYVFTVKDGKVEVTSPEVKNVYKVLVNQTEKYSFESANYSFKLALAANDKVEIKAEDDLKYSATFEKGTYLFNVNEGETTVESVKQASGKVTVYYSNSNKWQGDIYAYCWNDADNSIKNAAWPGIKCTYVSTNEYGESIYSYEADASIYDRIIFNNGSNQTKNLSLNDACLGYYGDMGVYAYGKDDYGKVDYVTLQDSVNLAYRGGSKEISVYTPAGYDSTKKYAVLVMFDAQNIFVGAKDAKVTDNVHGPWAVDVAITSLMANREDFDGVIILGIDNGDSYRNSELTMAQSFGTIDPRLTEGEADVEGFFNGHLDDLGNFILQTALPYVNEHYSTNGIVGICGSSSGGLGAYYVGLRDRNVYSYIGAFSPAVGLFLTDSWKDFYEEESFRTRRFCPKYSYIAEAAIIISKIFCSTEAKT